MTAVEPDAYAAGLLAERYRDDQRVTSVSGVIDDVTADPLFGSAVMINVLEHIADDQGALRAISDRLQPGAHSGDLGAGVPVPLQPVRQEARS